MLSDKNIKQGIWKIYLAKIKKQRKGADSKMNQKLIKGGHTSHIPPHASSKGITLIALVITIIVLLILAGVTINMVLGDDGIIGRAQGASEAQKTATVKEEIELWKANNETAKYSGKGAESVEEFVKRLKDDGITLGVKHINEINKEYKEYKEIIKKEKDESGIGNASNDTSEVTLTKEGITCSFGEAITQAVNSTTYNGNIETVKANANIIKLNKRTYTNKKIDYNIIEDEESSLVIDLNGQELIYTLSSGFIKKDFDGELYIIDTSENKTGKIIVLKEFNEDEYNYQENLDFNGDGVICEYDYQFIRDNYGKNSTEADWDQYKSYDVNGDDIINVGDYTEISKHTKVYGHIIELEYDDDSIGVVYTDVAEGAFISQCIHNK